LYPAQNHDAGQNGFVHRLQLAETLTALDHRRQQAIEMGQQGFRFR